MFDLSLTTFVVILIAGVVTGIINGVVGGGSLVSYLALTTAGISPVLAASTNTLGVMSGNPAALITPFREKKILFQAWFPFAFVTAVGSLIGGYLLVTLEERIFETLIPVLLIIAGTAVWIQPHRRRTSTKFMMPLLFGSGVYNGYFGPGQGILNLAILYRGTALEPSTLVILKNYIITASNVMVSLLFIVAGKVVWLVIPLLWISVGLGGWMSSKVTRRINEKILRISLTLLAFISSAYFIFT